MKLYVDASCGISGDMFVAALCDLGALEGVEINNIFKDIFPERINIKFYDSLNNDVKVKKLKIEVLSKDTFEYVKFADIKQILEHIKISASAKEKSLAILANLATAEAEVHGLSIDEVHFHEIGAYDTIIDIVLASLGMDNLEISDCVVSPINLGGGHIKMKHGRFSVPAPATLKLLEGYEVYSDGAKELTTPTGAAIIKTFFRPGQLEGRIIKTGVGGGDYTASEFPDILRLIMLDSFTDTTYLIETNIDDLSPEILGNIVEKLLEKGAYDAWLESIYMKKNRVGTKLSVLVSGQKKQEAIDTILMGTSTFGVRVKRVERVVLERVIKKMQYNGMNIRLKVGYYKGKQIKAVPEYDDIKRLSDEMGKPFIVLYNEIMKKIDTFQ